MESIATISLRIIAGEGEFKIPRNSDNTPIDIHPPKVLCGRVINIVIWEAAHWDLIKKPGSRFNVGKFIRLRNTVAKPTGVGGACKLACHTMNGPFCHVTD